MTETVTLHSCLAIERRTGVNRHTVRGLIDGLGLRTYAGPRGSVAIDGDGLARLLEHLSESSISGSRQAE